MKCQSCGANLPDDVVSCEYCGCLNANHIAKQEQSTFQRIMDSPQYANATLPETLSRIPSPSAKRWGMFALGTLAVAVAALILMFGAMQIGEWLFRSLRMELLSYVPFFAGVLLFVIFLGGIVVTFVLLLKAIAARSEKVEAVPAVVIRKCTSAAQSEPSLTSNFVTVAFESGEHEEFRVWGDALFERISQEEVGVLYLREDYIVDFDRVRIS